MRACGKPRSLPGRLDGPATDGPFRVSAWQKDHPILALFDDPLHGDLRTLRFRRITRIVPDADSRILVTAQGDSPLLIERSHGAGKCLLFAVPADNAWGEWAIRRLFVPLVHQLAGYATNRLPEFGPVTYAQAGPRPTEGPGVVVENGRALVRNIDPPNPRSNGPRWLNFARPTCCPRRRKNDPCRRVQCSAAGEERPDELWRQIAWGLLIVLVAEMFVGNRTCA